MGINKARFTGGEPTLYHRLPELIRHVKRNCPGIKLVLTSNGLRLKTLAPRLAEAGLDGVNISLDTLQRDKFKTITSRDTFKKVIAGIEASVNNFKTVKLNCVLIRGVNDQEVIDIIRFADRHGIVARFIEYMPSSFSASTSGKYISSDDIMNNLPFYLTPIETENSSAARYYSAPKLSVPIGFISPVSKPFCQGCNRLRLGSNGRLYSCLFSDQSIDLFGLLDKGNRQINKEIKALVESKLRVGPNCNSRHLPYFAGIGG
jgi:cyclic pyranopterin phosphate synthase